MLSGVSGSLWWVNSLGSLFRALIEFDQHNPMCICNNQINDRRISANETNHLKKCTEYMLSDSHPMTMLGSSIAAAALKHFLSLCIKALGSISRCALMGIGSCLQRESIPTSTKIVTHNFNIYYDSKTGITQYTHMKVTEGAKSNESLDTLCG